MAKPEQPTAYPFPVLEIDSFNSTLTQEDKIYARSIKARDINNQMFFLRERSGIEIEAYIGKPLDCVLEITKATFYDAESKDIPDNAFQGIYMGSISGYKFFPDLVALEDGETGEADEDLFDDEEADILATKQFSEWGVYGFGLGVYQDKPIIKTEQAAFFLNEYIFEEIIEKWEEKVDPEVSVCFTVEEFLLHGIKPYEGKWEKKEKKSKYGFEPKEGESYIVGKPRFLERYG